MRSVRARDQCGQPGAGHQLWPFGLSTEIVGFADVAFLDAATGLAKVTTEARAKMVESAAALIMGSSWAIDADVGVAKTGITGAQTFCFIANDGPLRKPRKGGVSAQETSKCG